MRLSSGVVVAILFAVAGCQKPVGKDVAATVNGRPITYNELDRTLSAQYETANDKANPTATTNLRLEALRALIDNQILLQRAEKAGLLASDTDVNNRYNELKAPYTEEQFQKVLEGKKMTIADLRAQLQRDISVQNLLSKEIGSHISISDSDIAAFYNANKASYNLPENRVRLAQILVTGTPNAAVNNLKNDKAQDDTHARAKIQMLERRLKQGEDFSMLAQQFSEDPDTAPNGGDLGFVPESTLDRGSPELRKLIENMTPGQVSQVIHTQEGYRLIKLITRIMAGQRELSDPRLQEEIRGGLFQGREQMLRVAYLEVARSEARVVNYFAQSVLASRDKR